MFSVEQGIQDLFISKGWTLALAESCTGGGVSSRLVSIPGASLYFLGSLVVYSNAFKENLLKVPTSIIEICGAVSAECAAAMCTELRKISSATWTGAITGIAGPNGGSLQKPVGTVFFAFSYLDQAPRIQVCHFSGSRTSILFQTQEAFLDLLSHLTHIPPLGASPLRTPPKGL